jgi:thiol-disulfide isomerase/thioredoxin
MKKTILIIIGIIIVVIAGFIFSAPVNDSNEAVPVDSLTKTQDFDETPSFGLEDYNGNTINSSDFSGKNLVINSWAAWCPFCRKELSDFAQAQVEFGDEIVIIAIDRQEPLSTAKKYSDELNVTDKLMFLLDPGDSFYRAIGGFSMPETIFVNKEGFIVDHKRGPMDLDEIRKRIQDAFDI